MTVQTLDYSARINTYGKACTACGTGFLDCVETVLAGGRACCCDCGRLDRPDTHSSIHASRLTEAERFEALKAQKREEYRQRNIAETQQKIATLKEQYGVGDDHRLIKILADRLAGLEQR